MNIGRLVAHAVFRPRRLTNKELRRFALRYPKNILEIGSGPPSKPGVYPYSAWRIFHRINHFTRSDVNPEYGHRVVDLRTDPLDGFDTILVASVLEHIYEIEQAISNLSSVKAGTEVFVIVPAFYPLHDEPNDYWRFTEHSLRRMFSEFSTVELRWRGMRRFPSLYSVRLVK